MSLSICPTCSGCEELVSALKDAYHLLGFSGSAAPWIAIASSSSGPTIIGPYSSFILIVVIASFASVLLSLSLQCQSIVYFWYFDSPELSGPSRLEVITVNSICGLLDISFELEID